MNQKAKHTQLIREKAHRLGFDFVGIAQAKELTEEARQLERWLNQGMHGQMAYMANHFEKRIDPRKLVEGAQTVISLLYNYHSDQRQTDPDAPRIAQYAYGKDYHYSLKYKLKELLQYIQTEIGAVQGRCFVDSAPVMERDWAKHSGLGWIGKNTLLITRQKGSFFFLAELIIDLALETDHPIGDYCGRCTRCIDACPTDAIAPEGYWMDARRCISYLTIELREEIPSEFKGKLENWMFGCDICQTVCPWNRFAQRHKEPEFEPHPDLLTMTKNDWEEITAEVFQKVFKKSAVQRIKYKGLMHNLHFLKD